MADNTCLVKVLLNRDGGFLSYTPGDHLDEVVSFELEMPVIGGVDTLLEIIWEQLNVDEPQANWAVAYRAMHNRSLSMGDVVVLGETAWTPLMAGWGRVSSLPNCESMENPVYFQTEVRR